MSLFKKIFTPTAVMDAFGQGDKSAYNTAGLASSVDKSNALYKEMYDKAMAGGQTWLDLGTNAANQLGSQMGDLTSPFTYSEFNADPSYQFLQDEAAKAVERSAAAKGSVYAPSTMKALQDRSQALASTEYGNAFNRDLASRSSTFDMLNSLSGTGQAQAGTNAQYGWNYADALSNNNIGLQNAILGAAQAKNANNQSMLGNWMNLGMLAGVAASDKRAKHNIKYLGHKNGHKWYEFSYNGSNKRYEGVMAQDVLRSNPDAVVAIGGVLHVNYGKLGLEMKEVV